MGLFGKKPKVEFAAEEPPLPEGFVYEDNPADILFVEPEVEVVAVEETNPPHPTGKYEGRLFCDGAGNLCADQSKWVGDERIELVLPGTDEKIVVARQKWEYGPLHGAPVRWAGNGEFVFVEPGDLSHNQRFHTKFVSVVQAKPEDPHFVEAQPGDLHFDETAPNKTFPQLDPDAKAAVITGHTEAYKGYE